MQQARTEGLPDSDRRAAERRPLAAEATLRLGRQPVEAVIEDLSQDGCALRTTTPLAIGQIVRIGVSGMPPVQATIVRGAAPQYGCRFAAPLAAEDIHQAGTAATVVFGAFPADHAAAPPAPAPEPAPRLPFALRVGLIAGTSTALWTLAIATVRLVG